MYLIVGIDPGTTSAFAAVDFHKKFVATWSRREAGREAMVEAIRSVGQPVIVACDVASPPEFVRQVAAAFNAKLFAPSHNLAEEEKRQMVRGYSTQNVHELDALAAALRAYHAHENKLRQIERVGQEKGLPAQAVEELEYLVINDVRLDDALEMVIEKPVKVVAPVEKIERNLEKEIAQKQEKLRSFLLANAELKKAVERLEVERKELQQRIVSLEKGAYERLRRDPEIRKRDAFIRRLQEMIAKLNLRLKSRWEKPRPKEGLKKEKAGLEEIVEEYRSSRGL